MHADGKIVHVLVQSSLLTAQKMKCMFLHVVPFALCPAVSRAMVSATARDLAGAPVALLQAILAQNMQHLDAACTALTLDGVLKG